MYLFCFHFSYGGTHHTFSYYFRLQCAILKQLKMLLMLLLQQCFLGYRFVFSLLFSSFTMTMMLQCGTFDVLCFIRYECAGSGLCFLAVCQYLCSNIYVYPVKLLQLANIYVFFSIWLGFKSGIVGWGSDKGNKHGKWQKFAWSADLDVWIHRDR